MNQAEFLSFIVAAVALLGSPGPAIAALLAVGRAGGWRGGLPFYYGLQLGLASAAGITIIGLFATLRAFPQGLFAMSLAATAYLLYLAYKIATSPVGETQRALPASATAFAGFFLGVTNPKAYLAFASLFASFQIFDSAVALDSATKWAGVVLVMVVVDIAWLWVGVRLGQLAMSAKTERVMNYCLAGAIILAAVWAVF